MFSFSIETLISGIMFFLGVYAAISMQKAAQQFVTARYIADQSDGTTSSRRAKSPPIALIAFLVVLIILLCIPTSYTTAASLSFAAGTLFATIVFLFKKVRVSFL